MVEFHLQKQKVCIVSMAEISVAEMSIGRNVCGQNVGAQRKVLPKATLGSGNRAADQCLCFHYKDSTIFFYFLNLKFHVSSYLQWPYSLCRPWSVSETPKTGFGMTWLILYLQHSEHILEPSILF